MILHNFNLHLRDNIQLKYDDDQQIKSLKNQLNHLQEKMVHAVEYLNKIVSVSLVSIIILSRLFKSHFVYLISTINCLLYSNLILIFWSCLSIVIVFLFGLNCLEYFKPVTFRWQGEGCTNCWAIRLSGLYQYLYTGR